jgi:hypothetical protein
MAITVQQFDLIASVNGIQAARAAAEQSGGVTGTRTPAPTQVQPGGASPSSIQSLTPGPTPGTSATATSTGLAQAPLPKRPSPSPADGPIGGKLAIPLREGGTDPELAALELITRQFQQGLFGNDDESSEKVVQEIMRVLGIDRNTALTLPRLCLLYQRYRMLFLLMLQ